MLDVIQFGHRNAARQVMRLPPHRNPGLELVLVENGRAAWNYGGRRVETPPGHVSFSWPWQTHGAWNEVVEQVEFYWIILPLCPGLTKRDRPQPHPDLHPLSVFADCGIWQNFRKKAQPVIRMSRTGRQAFKACVKALKAGEGRLSPEAWGWMLILLSELHVAMREGSKVGGEEDLERVKHFFENLQGRLGEPWTLEKMAVECQMGRTRFAERVKHLLGDTPMRVLIRMRVEEARRRLRECDDRIGEIADELGFGSSHYFATVFKRYTGSTPSEERNSD